MGTELTPLFQVKAVCINCEKSFQTSRVRPSFKKTQHIDTDFCIHYRSINPEFYLVRVCPNCGHAGTENSSQKVSPLQQKAIYEQITLHWNSHDYGGERTWDDALQTYKLALICAQAIKDTHRVIASLLHHIAWMYRYVGDAEEERRFLRFALDSYVKFYKVESSEINNARLMFIIGELHRRLGDHGDAITWFSRVINEKKIMDAAMIRACREGWASVREEMAAAENKTPDKIG